MDIIDSQTVVVYNHDDLNTALSNNNGYIYVHMGASFALTNGIRIHPDKPSLLIDGIDPRDPSQTIHTLTDYSSSSNTGCIYLNAVSSIQIVFQNLVMVGRNYYGMPCIYDYGDNEAVTVSYYSVTYSGPQITWHPRGLTRYVDCNITIVQGHSPPQEVGEVCRLEIGGVTTIHHNNTTTTNPTFLFYNRSSPSFTVLEDANVTITTVNDFFIEEAAVSTTLKERATLTLTTQEGISASANHTFKSFHLQAKSTFNYTRLSNAGSANTLYMTGPIVLDQDADFLMVSDFANSTGALIYFLTSASQITLNSPKRFALYNSGTSTLARPFYFGTATSFNFTCNQVDYWRAATPYPIAGTFDDVPPWRWHRPKWEIFDISGSATSTATSSINTSLTTAEQALLPPLTDMQLHLAKVFSVGVLPLHVNTIVGDRRPVTGTSLPDSNIRVTYSVESIEKRYSSRCMSSGDYSVPVDDIIPTNTNVTIASNLLFLLTDVTQEALAVGDLVIYEAPGIITFTFNSISQNPIVLPRAVPDEPVIISDERVDVDRTQWVLWAKIDGPLRTVSGLTLPQSVIFIRKGETTPITLTEGFINVHTAGPYNDVLFPIIWESAEGVLARITAPIRVGETYTANLTWTVLPIGVLPE